MKRPESRNNPLSVKVSAEQKNTILAAVKVYGWGFIIGSLVEVCRQLIQLRGGDNHEAE